MWTVRRLTGGERLELIAAALIMAPVPAVFVGGRAVHGWIEMAARHLPAAALWFGFGMTVPLSLALLLGVLCRRVRGRLPGLLIVSSFMGIILMWLIAVAVPASVMGTLTGTALGLTWQGINLYRRAGAPPGAFPVQIRLPAPPLANVAPVAPPTEKL